jgi:hypothetical protein
MRQPGMLLVLPPLLCVIWCKRGCMLQVWLLLVFLFIV